jgi:cytochrome oxidase Cu insertion factor (SCO1/SenC/PrrC family)
VIQRIYASSLLVALILALNLCGCVAPQRAVGTITPIQDTLDAMSKVLPFIDKGARANPHSSPRGRYSDKFPDTLLIDHQGKKHRFYSDLVKNRTVVIQFFYTTCTGI